jgi:hypothetical protein
MIKVGKVFSMFTVQKGLVFLFFMIGFVGNSIGQCAMCKLTAENSIVEGQTSMALGLNTGIIYLASFPYLVCAMILFLWFRQYRKRQAIMEQ